MSSTPLVLNPSDVISSPKKFSKNASTDSDLLGVGPGGTSYLQNTISNA